jgi:hypothetical protein
MKVYEVSGHTHAPLALSLCPLKRKLGRLQSRTVAFGEGKNLLISGNENICLYQETNPLQQSQRGGEMNISNEKL